MRPPRIPGSRRRVCGTGRGHLRLGREMVCAGPSLIPGRKQRHLGGALGGAPPGERLLPATSRPGRRLT